MLRSLLLELAFGRMNNDLGRLVARKLARPADDVFLGAFVKIPLTEGKWIKRIE